MVDLVAIFFFINNVYISKVQGSNPSTPGAYKSTA